MLDKVKRYTFASERRLAPLRAWFARPHGRAECRVLVLFEHRRVPMSQVYALVAAEGALAARHRASIRYAPNTWAEAGLPSHLRGADVVVFQNWLTEPPERLPRLLEIIRRDHPGARLVYFDGFANADLRFARLLEPQIAAYGKKSLFADRRVHLRPTRGDTLIIDYYAPRYGLDLPEVDWQVPEAIFPKLHLTPGFFTAPQMIDGFATGPEPDYAALRPIDLHARLAKEGHPHYASMRQDCVDRIAALDDLEIAQGTGIPWRAYIEELGRSKICVSPFGYGELCWRDVEAFLTGSVLLKPDMSHLETRPELYLPDETYVPIAWDFSDMEEKIRALLADPDRRIALARNGFRLVRDYLLSGRMAEDLGFVFEDPARP